MATARPKAPRKQRVMLTADQIKKIKKMVSNTVPIRKIAAKFNVSVPTIYYHCPGGVRAMQPDIHGMMAEEF